MIDKDKYFIGIDPISDDSKSCVAVINQDGIVSIHTKTDKEKEEAFEDIKRIAELINIIRD